LAELTQNKAQWQAVSDSAIIYTTCFVHGSVLRESMSITLQQDATLYSLYSLQTALQISGDTFTHHQ
jgi:hypothetical protein